MTFGQYMSMHDIVQVIFKGVGGERREGLHRGLKALMGGEGWLSHRVVSLIILQG